MRGKRAADGHTARLGRVRARVEYLGITAPKVREVINAFRDELMKDAKKGEALWPEVGVFHLKKMKGRKVHLVAGPMADGTDSMELGPAWKVSFRASKHQRGQGDGPADS